MTLDTDIEIVNLEPQPSATLRCVQLEADGKPVLVVGAPYRVHAHVLRDFLKQRGIDFKTMTLQLSRISVEIPVPEGDRYKVLGMGLLWIDNSGGKKVFAGPFGKSTDYEIPVDTEQRQRVIDILVLDGWEYFPSAEYR